MIIVAGHIIVKPGVRARFLKQSREATSLARATRGCVDFAVSADPIEKDRVNVLEVWSSLKALEKFRGSGPNEDLSSLIVQINVREYTTRR